MLVLVVRVILDGVVHDGGLHQLIHGVEFRVYALGLVRYGLATGVSLVRGGGVLEVEEVRLKLAGRERVGRSEVVLTRACGRRWRRRQIALLQRLEVDRGHERLLLAVLVVVVVLLA